MNKEKQIREDLYDKMDNEFEVYKMNLFDSSYEDIFDHSYETTIKEEMLSLFYPESEEYNLEDVEKLNKLDRPLDYLYHGWMKSDININQNLKDSIDLTLEYNLSKEKNTDLER